MIGDTPLLGDLSTPIFRPLVPQSLRHVLFQHVHGLAHPGIRATRRLLSARYVWPHLARDVTLWCRSCLSCQTSKVHRHTHLRPAVIPLPTSRFSHIHVDLVGPLPSSNGYTYLFTIVDRVSSWPEAIPLASTTADDCATALVQHWISRFGVPDTITSDRGPQFTSALWASLCARLNITHQPTTAYHPQANGLVERFHRRLKAALRSRCAAADWYHHLPWILLSFRTTPAYSDPHTTPS